MPSSRKAVCNWSGSPKTKLKPPSMSGLPAWSGGVLHRTKFVRGEPRWLFNFRKCSAPVRLGNACRGEQNQEVGWCRNQVRMSAQGPIPEWRLSGVQQRYADTRPRRLPRADSNPTQTFVGQEGCRKLRHAKLASLLFWSLRWLAGLDTS